MNERERQRAIERAEQAKVMLESEIMGEMFTMVERRAFEEVLRLDHADDAGRKHFVDKVNAIRALRQELDMLVAAGMSAARKSPTMGPA